MTNFEIGQEFINNRGDRAIITDFIKGTKTKARKAVVRFEDGTVDTFPTSKLSGGIFVNRNSPNVYGKGFIGYGNYKSSANGYETRAYTTWNSMLRRCYCEHCPEYENYGAKGVFVEPIWHNFQTFAEWYYKWEPHRAKDFHLDKDLLGDGLMYSPNNCCLLPSNINVALNVLNKKLYYNKGNDFTVNQCYGEFLLNTSCEDTANMLSCVCKIQYLCKWIEQVKNCTLDPRIEEKLKLILVELTKEVGKYAA